MKRDRLTLWTIVFVLMTSYAYFYQAGGWNQNSRFALVRAILEERTLRIDSYQLHTGDRAVVDGHYYSDKAPGTSLTALAPAALAKGLAHLIGVDPMGFPGVAWTSYLATVLTAGLFTVLAAVAIFVITRHWGYSRGAAILAAMAFGVGPAWCYATLFMGHGIAGGCLAVALACLVVLDDADARRRSELAIVLGFATGWSVVTEFQAAVPAAMIVALALVRVARTSIGELRSFASRLIVSGAFCALVLCAYNAAAFGSPFHLGYQSEEQFEEMRTGFFGISVPAWWRVREILFGSYRGLLPLWPLAAFAPVGLILAARDPRRRPAAVIALGTVVYYVLLNASYHYWEGGWAYGPRQIMTAMPFLALGLGPLWDRRSTVLTPVLLLCLLWGAGSTLVAEATTPQPSATIMAPMRELMWPAFRDGDFSLNTQTFVHFVPPGSPRPGPDVPRAAWNLGELAGLHGHASVLPLYAVWTIGAALLIGQARR